MNIGNSIYNICPKKLDWYIIKRFVMTFFIALLLIITVVIIFDISEKVDDFVAKEVPLNKIILDYYLNFIPYFVNMFSPIFVFITVIFLTSRLAANSEIIAVLSCGISFQRFLRPYMLSAAFITALSMTLNLWVIPHANRTRMAFETTYIRDKNTKQVNQRNLHYQINPGEFAYVESFSDWNNTAYKFTLEKIENNEIKSKLYAEQATWNEEIGGWKLKKYFIRNYGAALEDQVRNGWEMDTVINLTVDDFTRTRKYETQLNQRELDEFIAMKEMRGDADLKKALIEKHTRYAMPFSAFILTIMGVALSSRKRRGGTGWNLALGIALSFSYILFQKFSEMFVYTDTMPVWVAMWLPNVIYAGIAVFLYKIAPK